MLHKSDDLYSHPWNLPKKLDAIVHTWNPRVYIARCEADTGESSVQEGHLAWNIEHDRNRKDLASNEVESEN